MTFSETTYAAAVDFIVMVTISIVLELAGYTPNIGSLLVGYGIGKAGMMVLIEWRKAS